MFNTNFEEDFYKETFENGLFSENIEKNSDIVEERCIDLEEDLDQNYLISLIKIEKGKRKYGQLIIHPIVLDD